jgi:predicted nucleic acid-binding protein
MVAARMEHPMKVYLDLCSLKRPFDDQSQPRINLETSAVLNILQAVANGKLEAVRSLAHELENSRNPDIRRARVVGSWLEALNPLEVTPKHVAEQAGQLVAAGLTTLDAYHLAWAEYLGADSLVTTDDRFLSKARRLADIIKVRVIDPITLVRELSS